MISQYSSAYCSSLLFEAVVVSFGFAVVVVVIVLTFGFTDTLCFGLSSFFEALEAAVTFGLLVVDDPDLVVCSVLTMLLTVVCEVTALRVVEEFSFSVPRVLSDDDTV